VRRALLLLAIALVFVGCGKRRDARIVVGAKNFTEQAILAELFAQHIESRLSIDVERRFHLGGTLIAHQALSAGQIDLYPEYTGTALTVILNESPSHDARDVHRRVRAAYAERFGLEVGEPLGFDNTFAIVVRGEDARRLGLRNVSDLTRHAPGWRAGFGYEFMERPDGFRGWTDTYALKFGAPPRTMELGLLYLALKEKQVDVVAGNSTDGLIDALDLAVLDDDRHYFPPYEAVPIVRRQTLERHAGLRAALAELAGKISEQEMRRLNYAADGEGGDIAELVREFRRRKGL